MREKEYYSSFWKDSLLRVCPISFSPHPILCNAIDKQKTSPILSIHECTFVEA